MLYYKTRTTPSPRYYKCNKKTQAGFGHRPRNLYNKFVT